MCRFISRPHEFDPAACPLVSFARGVAKAHLDNRRQGKFFPYTEETSIDTKDAMERENLNGLIPRSSMQASIGCTGLNYSRCVLPRANRLSSEPSFVTGAADRRIQGCKIMTSFELHKQYGERPSVRCILRPASGGTGEDFFGQTEGFPQSGRDQVDPLGPVDQHQFRFPTLAAPPPICSPLLGELHVVDESHSSSTHHCTANECPRRLVSAVCPSIIDGVRSMRPTSHAALLHSERRRPWASRLAAVGWLDRKPKHKEAWLEN
ncbi:hypothetical protein BKA93DRAFT_774483 [Sparassis latifolia]